MASGFLSRIFGKSDAEGVSSCCGQVNVIPDEELLADEPDSAATEERTADERVRPEPR